MWIRFPKRAWADTSPASSSVPELPRPPNYDESCAAESRDDFVHKLSIALKELKETRGWLKFIPLAGLLPEAKVSALLVKCEELVKIVGKSVATAKGKTRRPPSSI